MTKIYSGAPQMPQAGGSGERNITISREAVREVTINVYTGWTSAVRELFANGVTAVKKAVQAGEIAADEGLVTVRLDGDDLSFKDNGTGITAEAFRKALCVYGSTTNKDRTLPGMFGTGFFSHKLLGRRCTIETMTRGGGGFRASCTDASKFEILGGAYTVPGTRITVHMDFKTMPAWQRERIIGYARTLAEYPGVAVRIEDGNRYSGLYRPRSVKEVAAEWQRAHPEAFYHEEQGLEVAIDPDGSNMDTVLLLAGIPVRGGHDLPFRGLVNMTDESVYVPKLSRDRLTEEGFKLMYARAYRAAGRELEKAAGIRSYPEYLASPHRAKFRRLAALCREMTIRGGAMEAVLINQKRLGIGTFEGIKDMALLNEYCFKYCSKRATLLDKLDVEGLVYCGCRRSHEVNGTPALRPVHSMRGMAKKVIACWKVPTCGRGKA